MAHIQNFQIVTQNIENLIDSAIKSHIPPQNDIQNISNLLIQLKGQKLKQKLSNIHRNYPYNHKYGLLYSRSKNKSDARRWSQV